MGCYKETVRYAQKKCGNLSFQISTDDSHEYFNAAFWYSSLPDSLQYKAEMQANTRSLSYRTAQN